MVNDMIYVFDTSSFVHVFRYFKADIFPSFWRIFYATAKDEKITSVMQVYHEVVGYGNHLSKWANTNKKVIFTEPNESEQQIVKEIFRDKRNYKLVDKKKQAGGGFVADPFVIAKAQSISGCVVTEDGFNVKGELKESRVNLASVCKKLDVPCLNFDNFMRQEKWKF